MTGLGAMMAGSAGGKRDREFFPTPAEVTEALLDFWRPVASWVWEPAVGDGAMANVLKARGYHVIPSDIINRGYPGTMVLDFLQTVAQPGHMPVAIVTNPPFSLGAKFIEHALHILGVRELAVLLKAQFWHTAAGAALAERHPPRFVLPIAWRVDFLGLGKPVMDVSWNVWSGPPQSTVIRSLRRKPRPRKGAKPT